MHAALVVYLTVTMACAVAAGVIFERYAVPDPQETESE